MRWIEERLTEREMMMARKARRRLLLQRWGAAHSQRRAMSIASIGATIAVVVIFVVAAVIYVESEGTQPPGVSPHASIIFSSSSSSSSPSSSVSSSVAASSTTTGFFSVENVAHASLVKVSILTGSSKNSTSPGYSPETITVVIGVNNTVTWTNNDNTTHTVTATKGSFNSGNLNPTQSFTFIFTTAGKYTYTDKGYRWMQGTVLVLA
jgi:plastocyanin